MEKIIEKRGDMMILKDIEGFVPSWKARKDKPESYNEGFDDGVLFLMDELDRAPTVDAVPVVRCKDCKYFKTPLCQNEDNHDNWFCADGERKYEVSE